MMPTRIEWAQESWSPVTGCSPVSEGCINCYAQRIAQRLKGRFGYPADEPFKVTLHPDRLEQPFHWRKPRIIFVCSMGDLFHPDVPGNFIAEVWHRMAQANQHTYLVLTKRPQRMLDWSKEYAMVVLPNVWLGVTAENQKAANTRIPVLLDTPAAIRFVSCEPLLGEIGLTRWLPYLDWVICGAETGAGKRPMALEWAFLLHERCKAIDVPFFFKRNSAGTRLLGNREWNEMPNMREGGRWQSA